MERAKVCNSKDLLRLVKKSHKFNRSVDVASVKDIMDPAGAHIVAVILFGHNADHAEVFHHRCMIYMKTKTSDTEPEVFIMDVADEDFQVLPTTEEVFALIK